MIPNYCLGKILDTAANLYWGLVKSIRSDWGCRIQAVFQLVRPCREPHKGWYNHRSVKSILEPAWHRRSSGALGARDGIGHVLIPMGDWCGSTVNDSTDIIEATGAEKVKTAICWSIEIMVKRKPVMRFARGGVFSLDLPFNGRTSTTRIMSYCAGFKAGYPCGMRQKLRSICSRGLSGVPGSRSSRSMSTTSELTVGALRK